MLDTFQTTLEQKLHLGFDLGDGGVREVTKALKPLVSESDRDLIEAVAQSLRETGYPALRNLGIRAVAGRVILTGRVPSYHQKQMAQSVVCRLGQVRTVTNDIEVGCP